MSHSAHFYKTTNLSYSQINVTKWQIRSHTRNDNAISKMIEIQSLRSTHEMTKPSLSWAHTQSQLYNAIHRTGRVGGRERGWFLAARWKKKTLARSRRREFGKCIDLDFNLLPTPRSAAADDAFLILWNSWKREESFVTQKWNGISSDYRARPCVCVCVCVCEGNCCCIKSFQIAFCYLQKFIIKFS